MAVSAFVSRGFVELRFSPAGWKWHFRYKWPSRLPESAIQRLFSTPRHRRANDHSAHMSRQSNGIIATSTRQPYMSVLTLLSLTENKVNINLGEIDDTRRKSNISKPRNLLRDLDTWIPTPIRLLSLWLFLWYGRCKPTNLPTAESYADELKPYELRLRGGHEKNTRQHKYWRHKECKIQKHRQGQ